MVAVGSDGENDYHYQVGYPIFTVGPHRSPLVHNPAMIGRLGVKINLAVKNFNFFTQNRLKINFISKL